MAARVPDVPAWYVPRICGVEPTGRTISVRAGETVDLRLEVEPCQSLPTGQDWRRQSEPILSAATTEQDWCRVLLYMPCVLRADGIYKMWYVGSSDHARNPSYIHLGYATSTDGLRWDPWPDNPIATDDAIPWGWRFQAPYVLYDLETKIYRMWFTAVDEDDAEGRPWLNQRVGYGESPDGISWTFHPEPVLRTGRRPCVLKLDDGTYRMWVNAPSNTAPDLQMTLNVVSVRSEDGLRWEHEGDAVRYGGIYRSCVYPFVMRDRDELAMWFGGHRAGGLFDISFGRTRDGSAWYYQNDVPTFPPNPRREAFDGRYTSTPHVIKLPGRYLMYYSARDLDDVWLAPDGSRRRDGDGVYRHVGCAELPVDQVEDPGLRFSWTSNGRAIPGDGRSLRFEADRAGRHSITCSVENGNGSAAYTWEVVADDG